MKSKTKTFTVGVIREKGDEVRRKGYSNEEREQMKEAHKKNLERPANQRRHESEFHGFDWSPTQLIGEPIMASDLMHLEFRRL